MWIRGLDEANLLAPSPALDFFFPVDRGVRKCETLIVDQAREVVTAGKARKQFVLMLQDSSQQISGHTGVQHMRTWPIGHDVNIKVPGPHIPSITSSRAQPFFRPSEGSYVCLILSPISKAVCDN